MGARSVAFTYNDPVIFLEYAVDVAAACREAGLKTVAVTAGYITADARKELFGMMERQISILRALRRTSTGPFAQLRCGRSSKRSNMSSMKPGVG